MLTRRALVAAGALGAVSATTAGVAPPLEAATADGSAQSAEIISAQALRDIKDELVALHRTLRDGLVGPSLAAGSSVADVRRQFTLFLRSNQKFPDYCEVGSGVFTDLYDWHVRYAQPIEVTRVDGRTAIRFMFTWMVMRPEQEPGFVGIPFDRG